MNSILRSKIAICVLILWVSACGQERLSPNSIRSLADYWEDYFDRSVGTAVVGYQYAIHEAGHPVAEGAIGYARPGVPMTTTTPLQIASVSKSLTAVALLRELSNQGIDIDAPMWPFLTELFPQVTPGPGVEAITIASLLSHTSGYDFGYVEEPRLASIGNLLEQPVPRQDSSYRYSNINYSLARTLLEEISGVPYGTYMKQYIFGPAGALGPALSLSPDSAPFVYIIGSSEGVPLAVDFTDEAGPYGWYASASAVARVLTGVRVNSYLEASVTKMMLERRFGWFSRATPAGPAYLHEGQWVTDDGDGNEGVHSGIAMVPGVEVDAALTINTNSGFSASGLLVRGISENVPRLFAYTPSDSDTGVVRVERPWHATVVRCTLDGSPPEGASPVYVDPILVAVTDTIRCAGFTAGQRVTYIATRDIG